MTIVAGRECGECTLCCKIMDVKPSPDHDIERKHGMWCKHCPDGKGCRIYVDRPQLCRSYFCGYRMFPGLGEHWYPRKSGLMINPTPDISIYAVKGKEDVWRDEPFWSDIHHMAKLRGMHGFSVRVYPHGPDKEGYAIDHAGRRNVPPLWHNLQHGIVRIGFMPWVRIQLDLKEAWEQDSDYIGEPWGEFMAKNPVDIYSAVWAKGNHEAHQVMARRMEVRGWRITLDRELHRLNARKGNE